MLVSTYSKMRGQYQNLVPYDKRRPRTPKIGHAVYSGMNMLLVDLLLDRPHATAYCLEGLSQHVMLLH